MENVRFTTPIQQLYNNPLHEGGPQYVGTVIVLVLYKNQISCSISWQLDKEHIPPSCTVHVCCAEREREREIKTKSRNPQLGRKKYTVPYT